MAKSRKKTIKEAVTPRFRKIDSCTFEYAGTGYYIEKMANGKWDAYLQSKLPDGSYGDYRLWSSPYHPTRDMAASSIAHKLRTDKKKIIKEEGEGGVASGSVAITNSVAAGGVAGITGEPPVGKKKPLVMKRKANIVKQTIKENDGWQPAVIYKKQARISNKGVWFAPGKAHDGYLIYKLAENYDGQVRGGIRKSWRYIKRGLTLDEAKALFEKKLGYKIY